jgi:hypothetical protein
MPAIDHIRYLTEKIGPRGSTLPKEEKAARYAERVLAQIGCQPSRAYFRSARSAWRPYALYSALILASALLFFSLGRWGAIGGAALALAASLSVLLELAFRPNPLRWLLPKGQSQNVWANLPPAGGKSAATRQVVLLGHLDSHRTPLASSSPAWLRLFGLLIPLGLLSSLALLGLYLAHLFQPQPLWQYLALLPALIAAGLLALTYQADLTPYSPGANDNASGAALVLELARRLKSQPLQRTTVWAVLSGCEEVGCYGAEAFARAHRAKLGRACWIPLDGVGGQGGFPAYHTRETFLLTTRADPGLLALAEKVTQRCPQLGVRPHHFRGAYTEGVIGAKYGLRVLSLTAPGAGGALPHWHRPSDTLANLDPQVLAQVEAFTWELLQEIDLSEAFD